MIQGFELSYDGVGEQANKGLKYLNPFLSTSRRLFGELTADQRALERLIVDTSKLSGALAERAPDISALVGNLNLMMNAIGERKEQPRRGGLEAPRLHAPGQHHLRQPARRARRRRPPGRRLKAGRRCACSPSSPSCAPPPPTRCRRSATSTRSSSAPAPPTTSSSSTGSSPRLTARAVGSGSPRLRPAETPSATCRPQPTTTSPRAPSASASARLPTASPRSPFFRAYTPELVGWFDDFGHSGAIDANGGVARVETTFNTFSVSDATGLPIIGGGLPTGLDNPANFDVITQDAAAEVPGRQRAPARCRRPRRRLGPLHRRRRAHRRRGGECDPADVQPGP